MNEARSRPLPAPFVWVRIYPDPRREDVNLRLGAEGEIVAAVTSIDGTWHATVNLHRSSLRVQGAKCASCEQGTRWVGRWVEVHAGRILMDIGDRRERLRLSGQKIPRLRHS